MLKRQICYIFIFCLFICLFPVNAYALSAKSAVVIEAQGGRVLMEKDAYTIRPMASTTKIMTALVALEKGNLEDIVTVSKSAHAVEGSSMWLEEGEKISLENLLFGLLMNSGNDAAAAIAEHIAGSIPEFSKLMNEKAKKMGLKNTRFENPHGLHSDNHYTTAYELALITREAFKHPKFTEIVSTKTKKIPWGENKWNRTLTNHNKMLSLYKGADGVKTGYTKASGRTLVSSATRDGVKLIAVTLNASDDWNDHIQMLNYGFSLCKRETLLFEGEYIRTISVKNGEQEYAQITAKKDLCAVLLEGDITRIHVAYNLPKELKAPIAMGQEIGRATAFLDNKEIASIPLISSTEINKPDKAGFMQVVKEIVLFIFTLFT